MLDVFFTVDVEVWCDGWNDIDAKFPEAFRRYVYGPNGHHGLPDQLRILSDHGLKAVCFVEPLFSGRFGLAPLEEIVGLIETAGHEAQLHIHTEWVDEARQPILIDFKKKRQHLRHFSLEEQSHLISVASAWLQAAGAPAPTAFRAGNFAFNADTLHALQRNQILIDSSYNASTLGPSSGVWHDELVQAARQIGAVMELPMTVFHDGRSLRHAQLTACSWSEIEHLLWQALEQGHTNFVILSHNFELLTPGLRAPDPTVIKRLRKLCDFLDRHRDSFRVRGLREPESIRTSANPGELNSPIWRTGARMVEQLWRQRYA